MNENLYQKMQSYAPVVIRIGLSLVFLWFGSQQLLHTAMWTSFIPDWVTSLSGFTAATVVHLNGAFEIVFGICLLFGYFTRVTALLLALHMLDITFTVGYTGVGVRDFGLSMAAISTFLYGMDMCSLDRYLEKKSTII